MGSKGFRFPTAVVGDLGKGVTILEQVAGSGASYRVEGEEVGGCTVEEVGIVVTQLLRGKEGLCGGRFWKEREKEGSPLGHIWSEVSGRAGIGEGILFGAKEGERGRLVGRKGEGGR